MTAPRALSPRSRAPSSGAITADSALGTVIHILGRDQARARTTLNLTPSENVLSPLARLPFVLDAYSRYYFDHMRRFGAWSFYGGLELGHVEQEVLLPLLRDLTGASFVNVQPISGLSCMTVCIAALTRQGSTMLTVPPACGGHMSTLFVAERLGVRVLHLPMRGPYDVDIEALSSLLRDTHPGLIYLDQSTQLFPIDPRPIRDCIDANSPETLLHFDSSHLNGLILFGALPNPLQAGAHSLGGSTHKTLPGPHKGFLATSDPNLAARVDAAAGVFVSHHHPAEVLSLTITLLELLHFDGTTYARRVLENAKRLARGLCERGVCVAGSERGFTGCHQVWVDPRDGKGGVDLADELLRAGVVVNRLADVPGFPTPVLRLSAAEPTRLGAVEEDMDELAAILASAINEGARADTLHARCRALRSRLARPRYCLELATADPIDLPRELLDILAAIERLITNGPVS